MSGKLTLDTVAGGSVTLTVDDTETGDIEYALDSAGIESGVEANHSWVKYPDGTMICHGYYTETVGTTTAVAGLFLGEGFPTPFSQTFISQPHVTATVNHIPTAQAWVARVSSITTTHMTITYMAVASVSQAITVNYHAIGRWK